MIPFEFPSISEKQWKQQIQFELKGLNYNDVFAFEYSGIQAKSFYTNSETNSLEISSNKKFKKIDDIITNFAKKGYWEQSKIVDFKVLKTQIKSDTAIVIDTSLYQNAGANIVQQLAYALCIADEYLKIHHSFKFILSITDNYFFELAKIYALHQLWGKFKNYNNLQNSDFQVEIISSHRNKNGVSDEVKLAIEQNCIQFSKKVVGTFSCTTIANQITEKAFALYELIKNSGGFIKQLELGTIQRKIKESAEKDMYNPKVLKNVRKTSIEPVYEIKYFQKHKMHSCLIDEIQSVFLQDQASGFVPFRRGFSSTMYVLNPWKNQKCIDECLVIEGAIENITDILIDGIRCLEQAENIIFKIKISKNTIDNIAKLRAFRVLWACILEQNNYKNVPAMIHAKILGKSIFEQTQITLNAIFGGVQYLETAPEIHEYLLKNTFIRKFIDPWGGNFYIEKRTTDIINKVWNKISIFAHSN